MDFKLELVAALEKLGVIEGRSNPALGPEMKQVIDVTETGVRVALTNTVTGKTGYYFLDIAQKGISFNLTLSVENKPGERKGLVTACDAVDNIGD